MQSRWDESFILSQICSSDSPSKRPGRLFHHGVLSVVQIDQHFLLPSLFLFNSYDVPVVISFHCYYRPPGPVHLVLRLRFSRRDSDKFAR